MHFLWKKVARIFIQVPKFPNREIQIRHIYIHTTTYFPMIFTYNHISLDSSIIKDWRFFCWNCWPFHQAGCCHLQLLKDGHSSSPFLGSFTWVSSPTHILLGVGQLDPPPFPENGAFNDNEGLEFIATGTPKKTQKPKKCKENPCVFLLITITHPLEEESFPTSARRRNLLPGSSTSRIGLELFKIEDLPFVSFWNKKTPWHSETLKWKQVSKGLIFFPPWIMKNEMEMKMLLLYNPSKLFESSTDKVSSFAKKTIIDSKVPSSARGYVIIPCRVSLEFPTAAKFQCIQQGGACCGFLFLKYVEGAVLLGVWDGFQNEVHTYRIIQSCAWGFFSVSWMLRTIPPFAQMVGGLRLWLSSKKQSS